MSTESGHTSAICAKTVLGTTVEDPSGRKIGEIKDIVLDKQSNNIMFAVIGFDGFMGVGEKFHPLPWSLLRYDDDEDAYVVHVTKEQLKAAPADSIEELTRNDGQQFRESAYNYYKAPKYW